MFMLWSRKTNPRNLQKTIVISWKLYSEGLICPVHDG